MVLVVELVTMGESVLRIVRLTTLYIGPSLVQLRVGILVLFVRI
jgi:hypothetical protein